MNLSLPLSYTHKHNPSVSAQKAVHKNTKSQELKKMWCCFLYLDCERNGIDVGMRQSVSSLCKEQQMAVGEKD